MPDLGPFALGKVHCADAMEGLQQLPDGCIQCCVTSPPYWGLRDYGVDGQLGLEKTPEEYVAGMVAVFREVRRVLRDDGTLWLNLGDSYAAGKAGRTDGDRRNAQGVFGEGEFRERHAGGAVHQRPVPPGLKPKDLVGIPWRVAFALQADGWYLRQDIIWAKPNPMPESVTDRCTKAHEYIFLLSKSARYYYDAEAVAEPLSEKPHAPGNRKVDASRNDADQMQKVWGKSGTRNLRSVWTITTKPYAEAHFATFPPEIPETCIKAGTSERGCCPKCGAPWMRAVDVEAPDGRKAAVIKGGKAYDADGKPLMGDNMIDHGVRGSWNSGGQTLKRTTIGWRPSCDCGETPTPCIVLDPFMGSGTTGEVALRLGRRVLGFDLNPQYCGELAQPRMDAAAAGLTLAEHRAGQGQLFNPEAES